jgi:hypothetical protein
MSLLRFSNVEGSCALRRIHFCPVFLCDPAIMGPCRCGSMHVYPFFDAISPRRAVQNVHFTDQWPEEYFELVSGIAENTWAEIQPCVPVCFSLFFIRFLF